MKKIFVVVSALTVSVAVTIDAQQVQVLAPDQTSAQRLFTFTPMEARAVKGMPYSAEVVSESVQTLADGNRIVQRTTGRVYRDSEGRVRREDDRTSGGPAVSITDPVAGTTITLDAQTRTARETPGIMRFVVLNNLKQQLVTLQAVPGKPDAAGRSSTPSPMGAPRGRGGPGRGAGGNAPSQETLANRMIEGVLASGIRKTTTIEKGAIGNEQPIKIVSEEWTSSELQVLVMTDLTDPRTGRSTYRLLKVNRAEPDQSLFQVPAGYTVQSGGARGVGAGGRGRRGGGGL